MAVVPGPSDRRSDATATSRRRFPRSARVASAIAVLVAAILVVHSPSLLGPARLTAHHDNLDGAAPLRLEAARQWKSGNVPLWNPWKRAGMPLLADTTAGAIYPGNAPYLFVAATERDGAGPSVFAAMDVVAALHAVLAGLFTFGFLRALGAGAAAATLGGLVYAGSGTMAWFAAWYIQIQNSAAWLPLVLLAVHRAATSNEAAVGWIAVGGVAVALQFFAGFPETSFYSGVIAILYALSLVRRDEPWRAPRAVASVYVAGIALAAVQLVPSLELQMLSRRPAELSLEMFQSLPASPAMVWSWFQPPVDSGLAFPPTTAYHFGAAAVLAGALGLLSRSRASLFFAALLATGFVLSIGPATPVSGWLHELPGFGAFRHPFKHLFELSFAMAVLAGLGADRLVRWSRDARWPVVLVAFAIVATAASLRTSHAVLVAANPPQVDASGARPAIADRIEPGWRVLTPRQWFQKRDPGFLLGDYPSRFRVPALHGAGPFLWEPLADATGMVEEETAFRRGLFGAADRTLAVLSTRYVVQTKQAGKFLPPLDASVWREVSAHADARLVERTDALPRVRFVGEVRCGDAATIAASLRGEAADPRDVALLACDDPYRPAGPLHEARSPTATIARDEAGHLTLETTVPEGRSAFLVLSQADHPGWRAWSGEQELRIHRVHGLVQGVEVPGGASRVDVAYRPRSFVIGALVSATAAVSLAGLAAWSARRRRTGLSPAREAPEP